MKLKTLFTIYALVGIIFGLAFLLVPDQAISSYGESLGDPGRNVTRYLGATFIGLSILAWTVRNETKGQGLWSIVLGFFVASAIGLVVSIFDVMDAEGNVLDWLTVVLYLFYTISFGYHQFIKTIGK
jgi:hypothetical protein